MVLPIQSTPYHAQVYDFVEQELTAGDIVVMAVEYDASSVPNLHPPFVAIVEHLLKKNVKAVFVAPYTPQGAPYAAQLVEQYQDSGKEYGVDMVNLGFVPGEERAIASLAESFKSTVNKDYYGNNVGSLPLLAEISSAKDAKAIFQSSTGALGPLGWIRQVHIPYQTPIASIVNPEMVPSALPYYQAGQLFGLGAGSRFAAEYEILLDKPGAGLATIGALTFAHFYLIVLIILGNVGWMMSRRTKPQGGK